MVQERVVDIQLFIVRLLCSAADVGPGAKY